MDTSFWTNLNKNVICEHTKKQFYGQYLCKLVMQVPWARISQNHNDIRNEIEHRKQHNNRRPNYGGSWYNHDNLSGEFASINQLTMVREIMTDYKSTIRTRVEEPWVQFYARNEDDLKVITSRFDEISRSRILSISVPKDAEHAALLKDGDIILKKDNGFAYKIMVRDGMYQLETKMQLVNYLDSLGDDIQLSPGSRRQLVSSMKYTWGVFFYVKDPQLVTFLSLIHPRLIRKIHKLTVADQ